MDTPPPVLASGISAGIGPGPRRADEEEPNVLSKRAWDYSQPILDDQRHAGLTPILAPTSPFPSLHIHRKRPDPTTAHRSVYTIPMTGSSCLEFLMAIPWRRAGAETSCRNHQAGSSLYSRAIQTGSSLLLYFPMTSPHGPIVPNEYFKGGAAYPRLAIS